ncbi:hypothetical protein TVAG_302810 [Trichomonas vaginalis G3]|uniref:Uncharacterized protein n=1 Tax=Trichomonas vaginalis (strain ATCC PRA-98 / G3) TaxID=412133 RepID=A2FPL7_TRIV3|nr:hypothetical protein TVAGG3_0880310 [Trichomonas vaginalis G3]EAX93141.1 hypothetical protein TVAG_302810 [Trichomonas vaginalis G3]KAI5502001.1 hypothetical protein TVAGG3_0880310 [Trichomonas vaginalis G3]|eukprot:XP_001306071.1 hypothetical protein [Trichomonas vaginalis G3]
MIVANKVTVDPSTLNSLNHIYANQVQLNVNSTSSFPDLNNTVSIHTINETGYLLCLMRIYDTEGLTVLHQTNQIMITGSRGSIILCKFSSVYLNIHFRNCSLNLFTNQFSDLAHLALEYYISDSTCKVNNFYYDEIYFSSIHLKNSSLVLDCDFCPYNTSIYEASSITLPRNITKMTELHVEEELILNPLNENSQISLRILKPKNVLTSSQFLSILTEKFEIDRENVNITNIAVSVLENFIVELVGDADIEELMFKKQAKIKWNVNFDKRPKIYTERINNTKDQVIDIHSFNSSIYNNRTKFSSIIYQQIVLFSSTKPAPESFSLNYVDGDLPISTIIQNINIFDGQKYIYGLSINDYPTKFYPEVYLDEYSFDNPENRNYLLNYADAQNHSYFTSNITRKLYIRSSNSMDYTFDVYNFSSKFDLFYGSKETNKLVMKFNKDTNKCLNSLFAEQGVLKIVSDSEEDIKLSLDYLSLDQLKEFSISENSKIHFTTINNLKAGIDLLKYLKYDYVKNFQLQIIGYQFSLRVFEDGFSITKLNMNETIYFYNNKMENFVIYITDHQQMTLSCDKSNPKPVKLRYIDTVTDITVKLIGKFPEDFKNNLMELPKGISVRLSVESEYIPIDISDCAYASVDKTNNITFTTLPPARFSKSAKIAVLNSMVTLYMKNMILSNHSEMEFISTMRGSKSQFIIEELNVEESSSVSISSCMISSTINIKKNSSISFLNSNISTSIMNVELEPENTNCIIDIKTTTDIVEPPEQINIKILLPKIMGKRTMKWTQEFANNVLSDK